MSLNAPRGPLNEYQNVGAHSGVAAASPHRLIAMLLERALARLATAKGHMLRGNVSEKGVHISGAMAILDGLRASLDFDAGGEIAANLDALYDYMNRQLVVANVANDVDILEEVTGLVREIRSGWSGIEPKPSTAPAAVPAAG